MIGISGRENKKIKMEKTAENSIACSLKSVFFSIIEPTPDKRITPAIKKYHSIISMHLILFGLQKL